VRATKFNSRSLEYMLENMKEDLELTNEISIIVTDYLDESSEEEFRKAFWK